MSQVGKLGDWSVDEHIVYSDDELIVGANKSHPALFKFYELSPASHLKRDNAEHRSELNAARETCEHLLLAEPIGTTGLGFAIWSPNINWLSLYGFGKTLQPSAKNFPHIVDQRLFSYDDPRNIGSTLHEQDLKPSGAFCSLEGEVIGIESQEFNEFVARKQRGVPSEMALKSYLKSRALGRMISPNYHLDRVQF